MLKMPLASSTRKPSQKPHPALKIQVLLRRHRACHTRTIRNFSRIKRPLQVWLATGLSIIDRTDWHRRQIKPSKHKNYRSTSVKYQIRVPSTQTLPVTRVITTIHASLHSFNRRNSVDSHLKSLCRVLGEIITSFSRENAPRSA